MNWRDNEVLYRWSMKDAEWWQFWMPQSGPIGGIIGASILILGLLWLFP